MGFDSQLRRLEENPCPISVTVVTRRLTVYF
jgi:hypothetical protein